MKKIALEDLITVTCEFFCENIKKIHFESLKFKNRSGKVYSDSIGWYNKRTQKDKRKISEKLLEIMEKDFKKYGQNTNSKRSINKKM